MQEPQSGALCLSVTELGSHPRVSQDSSPGLQTTWTFDELASSWEQIWDNDSGQKQGMGL